MSAPHNWKRIALELGIPSVVLAIVLTMPSYLPRISVHLVDDSFNSSVFPSKFTISNDGLFSIHSLKFICQQIRLTTTASNEDVGNNTLVFLPVVNKLSPTQTADFSCYGMQFAGVTGADMGLILSFRPSFTWRTSYRCQRFYTGLDTYRHVRWYGEPFLSDCTNPVLKNAIQSANSH